nr:Dihydrofolate reductase [uncultured bacterium]
MNVFIIAALTADGFIAKTSDHGADWTSAEDKKLFVQLTKEAGVMVMGSKTFATIGKALPGRRNIIYTSRPETITAEGVETTAEDPKELLQRLEREGAQGVAIIGGATIYAMFLKAGLVNDLYLTIEPLLFGSGVSLADSDLSASLKLKEVQQLNENAVLLHYTVVN